MFLGRLVLLVAVIISSISGFVSILGMSAIFPGGGYIIIAMMSALEVGKLVTTGWLHNNWSNNLVSRKLRYPLTAIILLLMALTSLGLYGFLSKSHLEQETPLASVELKINQLQQQIDQTTANKNRLVTQEQQLDQSINVFIASSKSTKDATAASKAQVAQKKQRDALQAQMQQDDDLVNKLSAEMIPLKMQISDVSAKLGPLKFVARLFGWQDSESAVQMVIVMIMGAFDPLAILLVMAASITLGEKKTDEEKKTEKLTIKDHRHSHVEQVPVMSFDEFEPLSHHNTKNNVAEDDFKDALTKSHHQLAEHFSEESETSPEENKNIVEEPATVSEKVVEEKPEQVSHAPTSASQEWLKEPWFRPQQ